MIRAAAEGVIDYSKFNPYSRSWFIRERLLLDELEHQIYLEHLRFKQGRYLLLAAASLGPEFTDKCLRLEHQTLLDYRNVVLYKDVEDEKIRQARMGFDMRKAWEEVYGDLSSAETQASIDAVAEWMKSRREAVKRGRTNGPRAAV